MRLSNIRTNFREKRFAACVVAGLCRGLRLTMSGLAWNSVLVLPRQNSRPMSAATCRLQAHARAASFLTSCPVMPPSQLRRRTASPSRLSVRPGAISDLRHATDLPCRSRANRALCRDRGCWSHDRCRSPIRESAEAMRQKGACSSTTMSVDFVHVTAEALAQLGV